MLILLAGCLLLSPEDLLSQTDADGDSVSAEDDCDDTDPRAAPGLAEACDGIDNDCDGLVDQGLMPDDDGDGYGDQSRIEDYCFEGWVSQPGDCDDSDPDVFPGQAERCNGRNDGCRSGWSLDDERGLVTHTDGGTATDLSGAFSTGDVVDVSLPSSGTVHICGADAPWHVALTVTDPTDLRIIGQPGADGEPPVLSANASATVISATGSGSGSLSVSGLQLEEGFAVEGAGLSVRGLARFQLTDSTVRTHHAHSPEAESLGGAGLLLDGVGEATISGCTFSDNLTDADRYGGGIASRDTALSIQDSHFGNNYAYFTGGAIVLWSGSLDISGSTFEDNRVGLSGGAIHTGADTTLTIARTSFTHHTANDAALFTISGEATLSEVEMTDQSVYSYAAVAKLLPGGSLTAEGVSVTGSTSKEHVTCDQDPGRNADIAVLHSLEYCDLTLYQITGPGFACADGICTGDVSP